MQTPRVLLITDAQFADDVIVRVIEKTSRAMPKGTFAVQLREKPLRLAWGHRLREVTRALDVPLVVNGEPSLARELDADGVHFGGGASRDLIGQGEGLWRSVAAHTDEDVAGARELGVDAALVSPIFATPGKGEPRGVEAIVRAVAIAEGELAVLALGGVTLERFAACIEAGARGVAMIRGLLEDGRANNLAEQARDAMKVRGDGRE